MKRFQKAVFLLLLLAVALLIGHLWLGGGGDRISYRTARISRGSIAETVTASGTLNPVQLVNVGTQVSGQVSKVYVHANDQVKAGQLLAEIDPALLEAQVKQDRASLETARVNDEQAERDMKRTRVLLAKDYVAKVDLEHAEQAYLSAKNSYDAAKTQLDRDLVNLNYAKITAPIDGVVISQDVTLGQTVAASFQTPNLFKIAGDLTKMKIDVNLSESDIGRVKAGMPVTFTVGSFPDREFTGKIEVVNLNASNQQGVVTYTVSVAVDNPDRLLLPGMTAAVSITLSERKDVLRVPVAALRFIPPPPPVSGLQRLLHLTGGPLLLPAPASREKKTLYLLRDDVPVPAPVNTGVTDETYVEVSGEGIAEGDTVITGAAVRRQP
jgi:HlyD family secretion protein